MFLRNISNLVYNEGNYIVPGRKFQLNLNSKMHTRTNLDKYCQQVKTAIQFWPIKVVFRYNAKSHTAKQILRKVKELKYILHRAVFL